jgi:hypothetical protein
MALSNGLARAQRCARADVATRYKGHIRRAQRVMRQNDRVSPGLGTDTLVFAPSMPARNFSGVWSMIGKVP